MKAVCPNNPAHKTFITAAHVAEFWKVNEKGDFIETAGTGDVVAKPDVGNVWICTECDAQAEVTDD